jgi:hypothetical protein
LNEVGLLEGTEGGMIADGLKVGSDEVGLKAPQVECSSTGSKWDWNTSDC